MMPTSTPASKFVPVLDADEGESSGFVVDGETGEGGVEGGIDDVIGEADLE